MDEHYIRIAYLVDRYINGEITPEEKEELVMWKKKFPQLGSWMEQSVDRRREIQDRHDYYMSKGILEDWNTARLKATRPRRSLVKWMVAASLITVLTLGVWVTQRQQTPQDLALTLDIVPGSNQAVLTLADGRKISLSEVAQGKLAEESGMEIRKTADGELIYSIGDTDNSTLITSYNTITTPNAGQYQVVLADGTKVWLNAGSSLTYPSRFIGSERKVQLTGEAYFEVANRTQSNIKSTFVVENQGHRVQVLGTHFNISAYSNQPEILTTLLEGSVQVETVSKGGEVLDRKILKPNQQSRMTRDSNQLAILAMDPASIIAWKDGLFVFDNTPLVEILREIERWYDVKVDYTNIPQEYFNGEVPRNVKLGEVLKVIELTSNLKFKMNETERKLMVLN
ncbi:FecR family protein [Sphingobacterium lumbrici]|uniref:FecR family protein n=1 Tax=Sphingobacterium lumbrici TaxID=2559600 RepID=UPI00112EC9ED|nr:FecR family protein [Sphingobacterium lumbrici]